MDELKVRLERQMMQLDERIKAMDTGRTTAQSGASTITVNAGGVGVWICVICCAVMVTALACGGVAAYAVMGDLKQDVRSLRDGEKAIRAYINTGLLKPKEAEDGTER